MLLYRFDIVGGPYDGTEGLCWRDDGEHPPPDRILVGTCARGVTCGLKACSPARVHTAYWTADERDRPARTIEYRKQEEFVERGEEGDDALRGRVVYAVGGLLEPGNFGEAARAGRGITQLGHAAKRGPLVTARYRTLDEQFGLVRERWRRCADGRHDRGWPR